VTSPCRWHWALWPLAARIDFPRGAHSLNNVNVISDSYGRVLLLFIKEVIGESGRKRVVDIREQKKSKVEESKLNDEVTPVFEEKEETNEIICIVKR